MKDDACALESANALCQAFKQPSLTPPYGSELPSK